MSETVSLGISQIVFADRSRDAGASADPVRLVQELVAVPHCLLRVLVDRDRDRLEVQEAMALTRRLSAQLGKRIYPRRIVPLLVVSIQRLAHHQPPAQARIHDRTNHEHTTSR